MFNFIPILEREINEQKKAPPPIEEREGGGHREGENTGIP